MGSLHKHSSLVAAVELQEEEEVGESLLAAQAAVQ